MAYRERCLPGGLLVTGEWRPGWILQPAGLGEQAPWTDRRRGRNPMEERTNSLSAFAEAVAARDTEQFARLVKVAYQAGATREDLLTAVEIGRGFGEPSGPVLAEAYATVHAWQWIAVRRLVGTGRMRESPSGGEHE